MGPSSRLSDTVVTVEIADKVKVKVGRSYIAGLMKSEIDKISPCPQPRV